jgi:quercetin dioxygenase-like cupin family protein
MELDVAHSVVLRPDAGETLLGIQIKVARPEITIAEGRYEPGEKGPPAHIHERTLDLFHVLEGEFDFRLGDEVVRASAGSYVLVPPGIVHTFSNPGPEPARWLNMSLPGGFDVFLRELVELLEAGGTPDAMFFERHDVHFVE